MIVLLQLPANSAAKLSNSRNINVSGLSLIQGLFTGIPDVFRSVKIRFSGVQADHIHARRFHIGYNSLQLTCSRRSDILHDFA